MKNKKSKAGKSGSPNAVRANPSKQGVKLDTFSTKMLAAELKRRQAEIPKLAKYAAALRKELLGVETLMAQLGGGTGAGTITSAKFGPKPGPKPAATTGMKRGPKPASKLGPSSARVTDARLGQPTLSAQVVNTLRDKAVVMTPTEIAESLARRTNRVVSSGFLVQISCALRQLVNTAVITQVGRGKYSAKESTVVAES